MEQVKKFHHKHDLRGKIVNYVLLVLASIFVLIPFFYLVMTCFKDLNEVTGSTVTLFPQGNHFLENLSFVWNYEDYHFFRYFFNTMFIFVLKTVGILLTCSLAGYAFAKFPCKLNSFMFTAFIAVLFLPGELLNIPFYEIMVNLNLRYSPIYVPIWIGAWFGTDITIIFLFRQYFFSIPDSLAEAAKIDGANEFTAFLRVMLPLSRSVIVTTIILYFVGTYNDVYGPSLYIRANDYEHKVIAQSVGIFENLYNYGSRDFIVPYHYVSIATVISILPVLVFFFAAQKNFVESLVGSGLKA